MSAERPSWCPPSHCIDCRWFAQEREQPEEWGACTALAFNRYDWDEAPERAYYRRVHVGDGDCAWFEWRHGGSEQEAGR